MKVVTLAVFGAGYVLGTKAGRQRYEQIVQTTRRATEALEGSKTQQRLQEYASRLEAYASQNGVTSDRPRRASRPT